MMSNYQQFFKAAQKARSPESVIKEKLAQKVQQKRKERRQRRTPFPVGAFIIACLGFSAGSLALFAPESWYQPLMKPLLKIDVGVFSGAQANTPAEAAKSSQTAPPEPAKSAAEANKDQPAKGRSSEGSVQEDLSVFNKLNERQRELDLREAELQKLEAELQKQKLELDEKIKQLVEIRDQVAKMLKSRVEADQSRVEKLVEVYSGMKPQQAAKVIETLNEDLAVKVLDKMKKKSASDILNVMNAEKAQRLSEMLAGYKRAQ